MTTNDDLRKLWKQEADQQRQDKKKKKKIIKKREVDIKFGGVKKNNTDKTVGSSNQSLSDSVIDDFSRSRLGLY